MRSGTVNGFVLFRGDSRPYVQRDAAYDRRDIPAVLKFYAPNFVYHDLNDIQDLAKTQRRLTADFQEAQSVKATTQIKSLVVSGSQAKVIVLRRVSVVLLKPIPEMPPPYFRVEVNQETWRKISNTWRLTAMRDAPLRRELRLLGERDQAVRRKMLSNLKDPALPAQMSRVDAADRARLKQILRREKWPALTRLERMASKLLS